MSYTVDTATALVACAAMIEHDVRASLARWPRDQRRGYEDTRTQLAAACRRSAEEIRTLPPATERDSKIHRRLTAWIGDCAGFPEFAGADSHRGIAAAIGPFDARY